MRLFKGFLTTLLFVCVGFCVVIVAVLAYAAYDTSNTLPSAGSSFLSDLQTFLRNEIADYSNNRFGHAIVSGGNHSTSGTLTATVTACVAFPKGHYVSQAAASHTYTASKRTYVYVRDSDSRTVTISGAAITYDGHFVFAEMTAASAMPTTPTGVAPLMVVDTSGSAITAVTDLRYETRFVHKALVADDGTFDLPDATFGHGQVSATDNGGNTESMFFVVETSGAVTKISGTTNTAGSDSDGNLCVYDGGTAATVKNRLAAARTVLVTYWY